MEVSTNYYASPELVTESIPIASAVPGSFIRISKTTPVKEWHSFATMAVPGPENEGRYSVIISRAGDWTSEIIDNPPTHMFVRGVATSGAMRIVPMFRRVVLVATGSGIAPIAPHVLAQRGACRLLWVSMTVRETFGDKLVDDLLAAEPGAIIYGELLLLANILGTVL